MPLSQRESSQPDYLDVLIDEPSGPLVDALDAWIVEAVGKGHDRRFAERMNVLAGREVYRIRSAGPHGQGRPSDASILEVLDLSIHLVDELLVETSIRPHRHSGQVGTESFLQRLEQTLREGRSAWAVGRLPDLSFGLVRRVDDATRERAHTVLSEDSIAIRHMRRSWAAIYRRESDPTSAVNEAVLAIEAAGRSVVSPNDTKATLGKMITALRDKPEKWEVQLGSVPQLAERLSSIWTRQPRHGVDDANDVVEVTPELAEAVAHDALTLVHWFRSGLIRRLQT